MAKPGLIALFGSGETSPTGRKIHDFLFSRLLKPVRIAILETPAGFQPNVDIVSQQIKEYMEKSLQNYHPEISIIQARKKRSEFDSDDPQIVNSILGTNYIFAGPGSPTYTVKNLKNSLAFKYIIKRHKEGATLSMASAAAIAFGYKTLPVYEIFKAGADLYWEDGLDFFGQFGLKLAIVTHWNNKEGGKKLDTSRCYVGEKRFENLLRMLDSNTIVLGIDEMTACIFDFQYKKCLVMGNGGVIVVKNGREKRFESGNEFYFENLKCET